MKRRNMVLGLAALSCVCTLAGATNVLTTQAQTILDETKFQMLQATSVRLENPVGLRFHTIASEFRQDLTAIYPENAYTYDWYTEIRFKRWEGEYITHKGAEYKHYVTYKTQVGAVAWKDDGWNTVLLDIPLLDASLGLPSDMAMQITAQSYVVVQDWQGEIVYQLETDSLTYSAAKTASRALAFGLYQTETEKEILISYVDHAIDCGDLTTLNLQRETLGVQVGCADWLEASTFPAGYGITYASADPSIAAVDSNGRITGVKVGTTTITASLGSKISKVCTVTVVDENDMPKAVDKWEYKALLGYNYSDTYPIYPVDGTIEVQESGELLVKHAGRNTATFYLDATYAEQAFRLSAVKAIRITIDDFPSGYDIHNFITYYNRKTGYSEEYDDYIAFYKKDGKLYLQINRAAYEYYLQSRAKNTTKFSFALQYEKEGMDLNDNATDIPNYHISKVEPIYDDLTLDFEDAAIKHVSVSAETVAIEKVLDRTMGRGKYSLAATTETQSMSVVIYSAYANKVFESGANAVQFRVYTSAVLSSVTVNGTTENVQYVYNADGEYYIVRIGNTYKGENLSVVLTSETVLGTVHFDAFVGTNKALGANMNSAEAYAKDDSGAPTYQQTNAFRFYAYKSVGDGKTEQQDEYIDMDFETEESLYVEGYRRPTLQSFLELKEAGFYAVMPQTMAIVGSKGKPGTNSVMHYLDVLDVAAQVGLKVILTDNILLYASGGENNQESAWRAYYDSEKGANGAAVKGTAMYNMVREQLSAYIDHSAFYGVLLRDEPSAWMLDPNAPVAGDKYRPGTYGFVYKTIKQVAKDLNKDIYIHANLRGMSLYSEYSSHESSEVYRYPELTRERYCEILGISLSQTFEDIGGKDGPSSVNIPLKNLSDIDFYKAIEAYIRNIGATGGHDNIRRQSVRFQIMRERFAAYCQLFIDATGAEYIAPDLYPLYSEGPMSNYIVSLQTAAEVAKANGIDLYVVSQTHSYVPGDSNSTRILSDADARWLNNTLLAFGVKNIIYFTYHQSGDDSAGFYHDGSSWTYMTGEKTPFWYDMQKVLEENQAFASTYQAFSLNKTKIYYSPLGLHASDYLAFANDVKYDDVICDNAVGKDVDISFVAGVEVNGDATIVSEFIDARGRYMYAVTNLIDPQYKGVDAYQSATITFDSAYTHAIVWRNGVRKLVVLDENHSITFENGAGESVYVIPYTYEEKSEYWNDEGFGDNGIHFPGYNA